MRTHRIIGLLLLTCLLLACSLPGFETATATAPTLLVVPGGEEETPTPIDTAVATAGVPVTGATVLPPAVVQVTATSVPVIPPTPSVPMVTPNAVNVNCRSGPDLAYLPVSVLPFGGFTTVAGRTADSSWWYVQDPNNPAGFCWVAADVVTIAGPTAGIPVAVLPPAIADKVTVAVTTPGIVVCGASNPVSFSGTISTNGTATVTYQWEITGAQASTTPPQTLSFTGAGTQAVVGPAAYNVDCGNYMVALHVTSPNDLSASKTFTVANP
jgi:hypothetical protein